MRIDRAALLAICLPLLTSCDQPGPLSAAARHPGARPPPPAWAAPLLATDLVTAFPNSMRCEGAVDQLTQRYEGARAVIGWAWNPVLKQPVTRVVSVNRKGRFVGFGSGGEPRPDVSAKRPEIGSPRTGWTLVTGAPAPNGVRVYGLDLEERAACLLGEIKALR